MRSFLASLSILWIAAGSAFAAGEVTTYELPNGMDVVVIEDHRAPVVVHMVWYRVGAADEPWGKSGIAHLLEHLMFKGTDSRGPGEFSDIVAENGGSENAFTSFDYTGYFQRVAADRLELMMQLESDRMANLVLTDDEVFTERDVVLEERNSRTDNNPGALFSEQRSAAMYMNHPYGIPIIGWRQEVETLSREDALSFYRTYYAPNNAILIVSGDVEPEAVLTLAKTYYGRLKPNPSLTPRKRPAEPPHLSPRRLDYVDTRVSQPYVIRTYLTPERNPDQQETAAALMLLAELFGGGGLSSVMARTLQLEQEIALHTSAWYDGLSLDPSTFGMVVVPAEGVTLAEAETAMDEVVAKFMETGVDEDHLARLKAQARAAEIYARDSMQGMARRYGEALTSGLTVADVQAWPAIIQAVTPEDIMKAAKLVFDDRNSVTGWLKRPEEIQQ